MSTFKKRKSTDEEVFCLPVRVRCLQLCDVLSNIQLLMRRESGLLTDRCFFFFPPFHFLPDQRPRNLRDFAKNQRVAGAHAVPTAAHHRVLPTAAAESAPETVSTCLKKKQPPRDWTHSEKGNVAPRERSRLNLLSQNQSHLTAGLLSVTDG